MIKLKTENEVKERLHEVCALLKEWKRKFKSSKRSTDICLLKKVINKHERFLFKKRFHKKEGGYYYEPTDEMAILNLMKEKSLLHGYLKCCRDMSGKNNSKED